MLIELGLFSAAFLYALAWKKLEFYRVGRDLHWHAVHANPNILHPWGIPLDSDLTCAMLEKFPRCLNHCRLQSTLNV